MATIKPLLQTENPGNSLNNINNGDIIVSGKINEDILYSVVCAQLSSIAYLDVKNTIYMILWIKKRLEKHFSEPDFNYVEMTPENKIGVQTEFNHLYNSLNLETHTQFIDNERLGNIKDLGDNEFVVIYRSFNSNKKTEIQSNLRYIILSLNGNLYIIFKGTNSFGNWLKNIKVMKKKNKQSSRTSAIEKSTVFHNGFYYYYKESISLMYAIFSLIKEKKVKFNDIIFTGHSLGGAIASVSSYLFKYFLSEQILIGDREKNHKIIFTGKVYNFTYGAPKYMSLDLNLVQLEYALASNDVISLINVNNYHFENPDDIVPKVPIRYIKNTRPKTKKYKGKYANHKKNILRPQNNSNNSENYINFNNLISNKTKKKQPGFINRKKNNHKYYLGVQIGGVPSILKTTDENSLYGNTWIFSLVYYSKKFPNILNDITEENITTESISQSSRRSNIPSVGLLENTTVTPAKNRNKSKAKVKKTEDFYDFDFIESYMNAYMIPSNSKINLSGQYNPINCKIINELNIYHMYYYSISSL